MKEQGKFKLLNQKEFQEWLDEFKVRRKINKIQQHHTYSPSYKSFNGKNHFELCESMETSHIDRGFREIAQNITTFPDGTIMLCRDLNSKPAGIKYRNSNFICIENLGNFDIGKDQLNEIQKSAIISITKLLLSKFNILPNKKNLVYHHWYDKNTGKRIEEEGQGDKKSCPGTNFFGGNTVTAYNTNFLPLFL